MNLKPFVHSSKPKFKIFALAFVAILALSAFVPAGKVYITHTGHVWFYSHTSMEDVEAHNYQVGSNLNPETGETAYSMLIKGFEFKRALMQEHFNENYMESDKYPKSTFKGKIANIGAVNFDKNGTYKVTVTGDLTMHGVTKNVTEAGTITVSADGVNAKTNFPIKCSDYNIAIPSVVKDKIQETLQVHVDVTYPKQ